jgi:hypothetical protein
MIMNQGKKECNTEIKGIFTLIDSYHKNRI